MIYKKALDCIKKLVGKNEMIIYDVDECIRLI